MNPRDLFPKPNWNNTANNLGFPSIQRPQPTGPNGQGFGAETDPFNGSSLPQLNENASGLSGFLNSLLNGIAQNGSLYDVFNNGHGNLSTERQDSFFQFLLQYLNSIDQRSYDKQLTADQRQYDWNRLVDQRNYDSPTNQLLRLMSTGMSRDAALAAISAGMSGGSGVGGSSQPVVSPVASAPSVSAPSGTQDIAIANAVIDGIGTIIQGVQAGFTMAESIENVKALQMHNFMSQEALQGYKDVKDVAMYLQNLSSSDEDFNQMLSQFSNADDLFKYIQDHKEINNFKPLFSSPAYQRTLGTPNGRSMFNDYWKSVRDTRDSGTLLDRYLEEKRLANVATQVDINKVSAEIGLIGSQKDLNEQKIIESCYEVAKLNAETYQQQVETSLFLDTYDSQVELADATAQSATAQAGINQRLFELNEAGFPMLKQIHLDQLQDEMLKWACINNSSNRDQRIEYWLNDKEHKQIAAYLQAIDDNMCASFAESHPTLTYLCKTARYLFGRVDPVGDSSKVIGTLGTIVKAIP